MKILLCLLLAFGSAIAQDFAYGKPDDLKGLKKVFVDTGADTKNRERIQKALTDSKLGFELLDSDDGAEIILMFQASAYHRTVGIPQPGGGTMVGQPKILTGAGFVLVPQKSGKPKLVMSFEDEQGTAFEKKPVTNFANNFIKAYKKANGVK
jgi:hypothetical protein